MLRQPLYHCEDSWEGGVRWYCPGAAPSPATLPQDSGNPWQGSAQGTMEGPDRQLPQATDTHSRHLPPCSPSAPCGDDSFTGLRFSGGQPGLGCCGCLAQLCFLRLLLGPLSLLFGAALCSQLSFALAPCGLLAVVGAIGQGWGGRGVSSYYRRQKGEVCAQPPSPGDVAQYMGQPVAGRPSSVQGSAFGGAGGT